MINTKNILTVDDATTISDDDTLFVGQNSQLKQIDYDLLADAILNKISSKSYSELDTTAKTLIGAIDELNNKRKTSLYLDRYDATAIASGANLNDYTDPGNYSSADSANATTLINSPYNNRGFILYVLKMGTIAKQIAVPTTGNEISMRTYNTSWSGWDIIS